LKKNENFRLNFSHEISHEDHKGTQRSQRGKKELLEKAVNFDI